MRFTFPTSAASVAACFALSGCGGSGGITGLPASLAPAKAASGNVTFTVTAPKANLTTSGYRRPASLSLATLSVGITLVSVNGTPATGSATVLNITPSSSACIPDTANLAIVVCTISSSEPAGKDVFSLASYDGSNGTGDKIGAGMVSATVPASGNASVPLTLNGIIASLQVGVTLATVLAGVKATAQVFVDAYDAGGAAIIGGDPYSTPITLSLNDSQHLGTLSTTSVTAPNVTPSLTIDATSIASGGLTVAASASGVPTAASIPITVSNDRNWVNGATFHYTGSSVTTTTVTGNSPTSSQASTVEDDTISTNVTTPIAAAIKRTVATTTTPQGGSPSSQIQNYYFALDGQFSTTKLDTIRQDLVDSYGSQIVYSYGGASAVDQLPETPGDTWHPLVTYQYSYQPSASSPYPEENFTQNDDGTYSYHLTYSNGDIAGAQAGAQSGSLYGYTFADGTSYNYMIGAPGSGPTGNGILIDQYVSMPAPSPSPSPSTNPTPTPNPNATPTQAATPTVTHTTTVAVDYYPATPVLTQTQLELDTYTNLGTQSVPPACGVAPSFGSTATHLHEDFFQIDPIAGETFIGAYEYWVVSGVGVICRESTTTTNVFYLMNGDTLPGIPLATLFPGTLQRTSTTRTESGLQNEGHTSGLVRASAGAREALSPKVSPVNPFEAIRAIREGSHAGA